jgi:hypothetical protein
MRAASWVARSAVEGLAKAARAVEVGVGTVVGGGPSSCQVTRGGGGSGGVFSGSSSIVTLCYAAGGCWDELVSLCGVGGGRCVGAPSASSHNQDL